MQHRSGFHPLSQEFVRPPITTLCDTRHANDGAETSIIMCLGLATAGEQRQTLVFRPVYRLDLVLLVAVQRERRFLVS